LGNKKLRGNYHLLISEAFIATNSFQVGIDYDIEEESVIIWNEEVNIRKQCKRGDVISKITFLIQKRHNKTLSMQNTLTCH
jgi:hypothetical protein